MICGICDVGCLDVLLVVLGRFIVVLILWLGVELVLI